MATTSIKGRVPRFNVQRETKNARRWWFARGHQSKHTRADYHGELWWADYEPSDVPAFVDRGNPFSVLGDEKGDLTACARSAGLRRKARKVVKLLAMDQSLKAISKLPSDFVCGSFRAKIRSMFPPELTVAQELSIKTSMKVEVQPCSFCEDLRKDECDNYKMKRLAPQDYCLEELDEFSRAFSGNIPQGWNKRKVAYIPNGHGTLNSTRKDGGNWNDEPFSEDCRVDLVYSSGKPRVVTMYSEHNVRVLTPLHNSLFSFLERKGWLLVGSPTSERLRHLLDGTSGEKWLSFDYESATDNIKTVYVRRAVEILIDKGEGLSDDEVRCLRVLSSLRLDGEAAASGQPMGSPMSFPLLCLVNKTVVDLALTDLLIKGEIGFKEWSRHRCLINGDDLLTRSTSRGCLVSAISQRGAQVGLRTNREKTMQSVEYGEINSTVFRDCVEVKKTNVASLWMGSGVCDVLGFASQATVTPGGFRAVVRGNVSRLARQKIKTFTRLRGSFAAVCVSDKTIKKALHSCPSTEVPSVTNLFPVEPRPAGFALTREEKDVAITRRVQQVKDRGAFKSLHSEMKRINALRKNVKSYELEGRCKPYALIKPKKPVREDRVLSIFARSWEWKRKEELRAADPFVPGDFQPVTDLKPIGLMLDLIKTWKQKKESGPIPFRPPGCPLSEGIGYVSLTDE